MTSHIAVETIRSVRVLRLNRPEAMNALTEAMLLALRDEIARAGADQAVRCILLAAEGRAFSAGADLKDPMMGFDLPPEAKADKCRETLGGLMNGLIRDIASAPVPVVAAVAGVAAGGGVGLALAADMVIAAKSARFLLGFVPLLGLTPDLGATWQLVHKVGRGRALGAMLTGREIDAARALDWGLVWDVIADEALFDTALALAEQLAAGPNEAQMKLRDLIDAAQSNGLSDQLDLECEAQASRTNSPETAEAIAAFLGKRRPDFVGLGRKV